MVRFSCFGTKAGNRVSGRKRERVMKRERERERERKGAGDRSRDGDRRVEERDMCGAKKRNPD